MINTSFLLRRTGVDSRVAYILLRYIVVTSTLVHSKETMPDVVIPASRVHSSPDAMMPLLPALIVPLIYCIAVIRDLGAEAMSSRVPP